MDNRKKPSGSSASGSLVFWSSSFLQQPARALIVDASPPWWSEISKVVCDALDNFLSLACSLDGPCRIPLLSFYVINRGQDCLLPFVPIRANLARMNSCLEELRCISGEGCVRETSKVANFSCQAVLDILQQFKRCIQQTNQGCNNAAVEVTLVTSQPGRAIVQELEKGLKDADLVSLRRLLVVQICGEGERGQDATSPEANQAEDATVLGTEVDLQQVENNVFAMESVLKTWLQEQGGDREHLQLQLPSPSDSRTPVLIKCDMQERLISPTLIPLIHSLGGKTESIKDFQPAVKDAAKQNATPQKLKAIKVLHADGVCESVLYGLPLVIRPTTCWQLEWDEMESNHNLFQALCHTLRSRDLFLLLQMESEKKSLAGDSVLSSYYLLQPSPSLSLLLKPVVSRELLLPCSLPVLSQHPAPSALQTLQGSISQLSEDFVLNPLSLKSNLYQHLKFKSLRHQTQSPYRLPNSRDHPQAQTSKNTSTRQPRQLQNQGRQQSSNYKVRATVAPLPSASSFASSSLGPPTAKTSRPALSFLSTGRRARASPRQEEDNDDDPVIIE